MAISPAAAQRGSTARSRAFHPLRVSRVVPETDDARSLVLDVPATLRDAFAYRAGQFLTLRLTVGGEVHHRSYSMSSSPDVDDELRISVKRVPGGVVSNWIYDNVRAGDVLEASPPMGVFCLGADDGRDVVAFAAGSGITPVISIVKTALATTSRRVRLLYANRDRDAAMFAADLDELVVRHPDRLRVDHHLDCEEGFVDAATIAPYADEASAADTYICGPAAFMDVVERTLLEHGVATDRVHVERFTPAAPVPAAYPQGSAAQGAAATSSRVTIELDGKVETTEHRAGTTILQTARQAGLSAPFSCESGNCATCMAKLVEGEVTMHVNDALTDDEVADGWILTCQSVPQTPTVHVVYDYED